MSVRMLATRSVHVTASLLKATWESWSANEPVTYSAAAAYFAIFSLPGLMIIILSVTSFVLDEDMVRYEMLGYIGDFIGQDVADSIGRIIDRARLSGNGFWTLVIGGAVLAFGATGLFNQLKKNFNVIWDVRPLQEKAVLRLLASRAVSLGMAIILGFLLLVFMYVSAGMKLLGNWLVRQWPEAALIQMLELTVSFIMIALLFTFTFKILPDVFVRLKHALAGGVLASFLFMVGEAIFTKALEILAPESVFGAAGSIVLLMIWVTYTCMILQVGAAFIKALMMQSDREMKAARFFEMPG